MSRDSKKKMLSDPPCDVPCHIAVLVSSDFFDTEQVDLQWIGRNRNKTENQFTVSKDNKKKMLEFKWSKLSN